MNIIKKCWKGKGDLGDEAFCLIFIGVFGGALLGGVLVLFYKLFIYLQYLK